MEVGTWSLGSCKRILAKLSIIAFLFHSRASSSNILIRSLAPLSFFSSTMGGLQGLWGWSCKGSMISSPNSLYPNLVGDMQWKIENEWTTLIPLIWILNRYAKNYRYNHKYKYAAGIMLEKYYIWQRNARHIICGKTQTHKTRETQIYVVHPVWATSTPNS